MMSRVPRRMSAETSRVSPLGGGRRTHQLWYKVSWSKEERDRAPVSMIILEGTKMMEPWCQWPQILLERVRLSRWCLGWLRNRILGAGRSWGWRRWASLEEEGKVHRNKRSRNLAAEIRLHSMPKPREYTDKSREKWWRRMMLCQDLALITTSRSCRLS